MIWRKKRRMKKSKENKYLGKFMDYSYLARLKKPAKKLTDESFIKTKLAEALEEAVKKAAAGKKKMPLAFSGELDSSILAYLVAKYAKSILFCVGFKDSYDVANAEKSAKCLKMDLEIVLLDGFDLNEYRAKTIEIIKTDNRLQTELALPLFILSEFISKKGYKYLMTGQGADTLFGGFDKYSRSRNMEDDIFSAAANIYESNLKRDLSIGRYFNLELFFPYLEENMVKLALKIPAELKIRNEIRKYILREAWRGVLPDEILDQNKKAFQYGSGIHKAFKKRHIFPPEKIL